MTDPCRVVLLDFFVLGLRVGGGGLLLFGDRMARHFRPPCCTSHVNPPRARGLRRNANRGLSGAADLLYLELLWSVAGDESFSHKFKQRNVSVADG